MIDSIVARNHLYKSIRHFFSEMEYLEVETPIVVPTPGMEVHLDYFATEWKDSSEKTHSLFLRSSPELHMKQYLSQGYSRIFQIAKCFRNNGELSDWHNPEFTMLEWYETGIGFEKFIDQTHNLLKSTADLFNKEFSTTNLELTTPPLKLPVSKAFFDYTGIELVDGDSDLAAKCREMGSSSVRRDDDFETAFFKQWLDHVEPELKKMDYVVVYDFPASQAALANVNDGYAKRFEFYVKGVELCNAFEELTCGQENALRHKSITEKRNDLKKQAVPEDTFFLRAMNKDIDDCCGNALGVDRLLALLLGSDNLQSVIPFSNQIFNSQQYES